MRALRLFLGTVLSLVCLWLAFRGVNLENSSQALRQADQGILLLAVATLGLSTLTKGLRWRVLFALRPAPPSLGTILESLLIGQMLNLALPLRLGDLARAYDVGRGQRESKAFALGTIAVEKVLDVWMLVLLAAALVPFMAFPAWVQDSTAGLLILSLLFLLFTVLFLRARERLRGWLAVLARPAPERWRKRLMEAADSALASLDTLHRRDLLLQVWIWSVAAWLIGAGTNWLVFRALGMDLSFVPALFLLIVLQAGIAVPSSPGKIGVFQFLCTLSLSVFAVNPDLAFGYSWALYLVVVVPIALAGGILLWWRSAHGQHLPWWPGREEER